VNLNYLFEMERIHAIGRNRGAVQSDRDPL